jgi:uncharacterized protein YndB with AHSA1/START domain
MTEVNIRVPASPEQVWAVLADGWSYAGWVVGASHIRQVDAGWPAPEARIHHSVGIWPFEVHDITKVRAADPPRMLELDAHLWPFGEALVRFELTEIEPGATQVRMFEALKSGPGTLLPKALQDLLLVPRNKETLARLRDLAVRREAGDEQVAGNDQV